MVQAAGPPPPQRSVRVHWEGGFSRGLRERRKRGGEPPRGHALSENEMADAQMGQASLLLLHSYMHDK